MSNRLNYKQATNVERRTWDLETYEKKAKARAKAQKEGSGGKNVGPVRQSLGEKRSLDGDDDDEKEEFIKAAPGAAGPEKSKRAFLKSRRNKVDIDSKIGSTEMVSAETIATTKTGDVKDGVTKTGVGWHCKVCDCFLKDSHTYLDHINGKKHQRKLGYSMRVERSTKEQIQEKLRRLAKEKGENDADETLEVEIKYEDLVRQKDEAERRKKEERTKRREERKKRVQEQVEDDDDDEEVEAEGIHPDMAAMMGFAGFGGGSKNH